MIDRNELSRAMPYGGRVTYLDVTNKLQQQRETIVNSLAEHWHRDGHMAPELVPGAPEQDREIQPCQTCKDARSMLSYIDEMLLTIEIEFRATEMESRDPAIDEDGYTGSQES